MSRYDPGPSLFSTSRNSQELLPLRLWTCEKASTRVLQESMIGSDHPLVTCHETIRSLAETALIRARGRLIFYLPS